MPPNRPPSVHPCSHPLSDFPAHLLRPTHQNRNALLGTQPECLIYYLLHVGSSPVAHLSELYAGRLGGVRGRIEPHVARQEQLYLLVADYAPPRGGGRPRRLAGLRDRPYHLHARLGIAVQHGVVDGQREGGAHAPGEEEYPIPAPVEQGAEAPSRGAVGPLDVEGELALASGQGL